MKLQSLAARAAVVCNRPQTAPATLVATVSSLAALQCRDALCDIAPTAAHHAKVLFPAQICRLMHAHRTFPCISSDDLGVLRNRCRVLRGTFQLDELLLLNETFALDGFDASSLADELDHRLSPTTADGSGLDATSLSVLASYVGTGTWMQPKLRRLVLDACLASIANVHDLDARSALLIKRVLRQGNLARSADSLALHDALATLMPLKDASSSAGEADAAAPGPEAALVTEADQAVGTASHRLSLMHAVLCRTHATSWMVLAGLARWHQKCPLEVPELTVLSQLLQRRITRSDDVERDAAVESFLWACVLPAAAR
jgi:hypothetical protein